MFLPVHMLLKSIRANSQVGFFIYLKCHWKSLIYCICILRKLIYVPGFCLVKCMPCQINSVINVMQVMC